VAWDADGEGEGPVGDPSGVLLLGGEDEGEGARPESFREPLSGWVELDDLGGELCAVADEGEGFVGASLELAELLGGFEYVGGAAEAVDCLRGVADQAP